MSCEPNDLLRSARCNSCLTSIQHQQVQTYLLAALVGGSTDPNVLIQNASAFGGLPPIILQWIKSYLLCHATEACVTPPAPSNLTVDSEIPNEAQISWTYATDPDADFIASVSSVPGGPYTLKQTFAASARNGALFFEDSGTFYVVVYARNSLTCQSVASNEVEVTV